MEIATREKRLHGQDVMLVNEEVGLFGVFDGVGSYSESGTAAAVAARTVEERIGSGGTKDPDALAAALAAAHREILRTCTAATTATIVWMEEQNRSLALHWASIGDSRLYLFDASRVISQVTEDEGYGNVLSNWLGVENFHGVSQHGTRSATRELTALLVTDGITGDFGTDILDLPEIASCMDWDSMDRSAENLLAASRKHDDKSVILVRWKAGE